MAQKGLAVVMPSAEPHGQVLGFKPDNSPAQDANDPVEIGESGFWFLDSLGHQASPLYRT
jgi:hypothetical protein